jgi:hypothetical protein
MVRMYRKYGAKGVAVDADTNDASMLSAIKTSYAALLMKGETPSVDGWSGYRFANDTEGDGRAGFVDLSIYHPIFDGKYSGHAAIDLPYFYCTMSQAEYPAAEDVWKYATKQPNAGKIGPLGIRAGLDITELYTQVLRFELFSDAKLWVSVVQNESNQEDVYDARTVLVLGCY